MSTVTIRDAELKDAGYLLEIYSYAGSFVGRAAYNHSCEMTIYLDHTARKCGMGYTKAGEFHKCGYKFGRWYDMIWMEKLIGGHPDGDGNLNEGSSPDRGGNMEQGRQHGTENTFQKETGGIR